MFWAALLVDVIIFQLIAAAIMTTTCNYIAIRGVVSVGDFVTCSFKCNYHNGRAAGGVGGGAARRSQVMLPAAAGSCRF